MAADPITILLFPDTDHTEPEDSIKLFSGNMTTTWYDIQQNWGYNDVEMFSIRVRKIDGTYMQLGEIPEMPYIGMGEFIQDLGYMAGTGRNGHVFQTVVQPTPTPDPNVINNGDQMIISTVIKNGVEYDISGDLAGKTLIADAITDKGVQTSASDSFATMASNIGLIETANQTIENIITQNPTLKNGIRIHRTTINSNASNPPVKKSDSEFYTIDHNVYIVGVLSGYNDSQVTGKIICIGTDGIIQNVDTGRCTGYAISFGQVEGESDLIYIYSYNSNYNYAICTYNLSTKQLTQISSPYQITSTITPYTEPKTVNINLVTDYNQYDYEKIYDYLIN